MGTRVVYAIAGIALVAAGIAAAFFAGRLGESDTATAPAAPLVEVTRPQSVPAPPAIVETGFVRASERIDVAPEVSGRIVEIGDGFALGARVAEGELLVRLSSSTIETEQVQARARLERAEAAEAQASAALMRQEELAENDFASEAELERVRADAAAARAEVEQAEAAIEAARLRLEDTRLTAPFDAIVISEDASRGQLLQVGTPIGTLVAANVAEVRTGLTERDFRRLRQGGALLGQNVRVEAGEGAAAIPGTISAFAPALEGRARTVEIVAEVEDPFAEDRGLILNGVVTVEIPLPEPRSTLWRLPSSALQAGERLWRVGQDGRLAPVEASIQERGDGEVFVISDQLSSDDRILLTRIANPLSGLQVRLREPENGVQSVSGDGS